MSSDSLVELRVSEPDTAAPRDASHNVTFWPRFVLRNSARVRQLNDGQETTRNPDYEELLAFDRGRVRLRPAGFRGG